jgi:hypothetical protein
MLCAKAMAGAAADDEGAAAEAGQGGLRRRRLAPQERAWLYRAFDTQYPTGGLISAPALRAILAAGQTSDPPALGAGVTEQYVRSAQRSWRGLKGRARLGLGAVSG